jgi:hypothetical protein
MVLLWFGDFIICGAAMGMKFVVAANNFRYRLALFIFSFCLVWPLIHMVLVNSLGISTWRLFGWGMYATPNPESQLRLSVVITDNNLTPSEIDTLYKSFNNLSSEEQDSMCLNLFLHDSDNKLTKLPRTGLCKQQELADKLDYFMHFRSTKNLGDFVEAALRRTEHQDSEAWAFLVRQRYNLFRNEHYQESEVYLVKGGLVKYMGKISNKEV